MAKDLDGRSSEVVRLGTVAVIAAVRTSTRGIIFIEGGRIGILFHGIRAHVSAAPALTAPILKLIIGFIINFSLSLTIDLEKLGMGDKKTNLVRRML